MVQPPTIPGPPKRPKRWDWHRTYNSEDQHPMWRVVALRSGARIPEVLTIKNYLKCGASRAKAHGYVGPFDPHECAVAFEIEPAVVVSVIRVLIEKQYLNRDHVIVGWDDDQPPLEDPTAALRQKNKRRRDTARMRAAAGIATADDLGLLEQPERDALQRLAAMSRVTADANVLPPAVIQPFVPIRAKEESHSALELARQENEQAAVNWLLGDGVAIAAFGTAARIVSANYGCNLINADGMIRDWRDEMQYDYFALACIISGVYEQGLVHEAFRSVVEQRIEAAIEERTAGLKLPFGPTMQRGGRSA